MFNQSGENTWVVFVYGYFTSMNDKWNNPTLKQRMCSPAHTDQT